MLIYFLKYNPTEKTDRAFWLLQEYLWKKIYEEQKRRNDIKNHNKREQRYSSIDDDERQ